MNAKPRARRTAELLKERMEALNLSKNDIAKLTGYTYEHVRSWTIGVVPTTRVLPMLASVLKLNLHELERTVLFDNIDNKFGELPKELTGKDPELAPIEQYWPRLSAEHKSDVIEMVRNFAKRDWQGGKK